MHLSPLDIPPFVPTEKRPGHLVLTGHGCERLGDNLAPVRPLDANDNERPMLAHNADGWPRWWLWALMGLPLGLGIWL